MHIRILSCVGAGQDAFALGAGVQRKKVAGGSEPGELLTFCARRPTTRAGQPFSRATTHLLPLSVSEVDKPEARGEHAAAR